MAHLSGWLLPLIAVFFVPGALNAAAQTTPERGYVHQIAVSGDGRVMAVAYFADNTVYPIDFFDTSTLELPDRWTRHNLG